MMYAVIKNFMNGEKKVVYKTADLLQARDCEMVMDGIVIARFSLCLGCKKEMEETYKNVLNKPLTAQ